LIDDDTETRTRYEQDWPQDIPRIAFLILPDTFIRLEELVCIQQTAWFNSEFISEFNYALQKSFLDVYILKDNCHVGYLQKLMLMGAQNLF
jgi:hypothetical protein